MDVSGLGRAPRADSGATAVQNFAAQAVAAAVGGLLGDALVGPAGAGVLDAADDGGEGVAGAGVEHPASRSNPAAPTAITNRVCDRTVVSLG